MNIAVVELDARCGSRTAMLQGALTSIDIAAELDPAPDLIVLPAFADLDRVRAGNSEHIERIIGQTSAAIGQRGRSWGVFVSFGMAAREGDRIIAATILLDSDGDMIAAHRSAIDAAATGLKDVPACQMTDTIFGRIALMGDAGIDRLAAWENAARGGAGLVIATFGAKAVMNPKRAAALGVTLKRLGMPFACAGLVEHPGGSRDATEIDRASMIFDASGEPIDRPVRHSSSVRTASIRFRVAESAASPDVE
ncbi:MAG: hypothetical protein KF841_04285 [Phycisphaerae bacterium]|nr:hypothetical protein [Phycisphaerae bacterium]